MHGFVLVARFQEAPNAQLSSAITTPIAPVDKSSWLTQTKLDMAFAVASV